MTGIAGFRWVIVAGLVLLTACASTEGHSNLEEGIRGVMVDQELAWDAGDLPGYMAGYDPEVCFIGRNGRTCGRDAVARNYEKSYPDRSAMGDLRFTIHEVVPVGADHAWVTGNWELERAADTLAGGFTLLWRKGGEGWRILRDHSY